MATKKSEIIKAKPVTEETVKNLTLATTDVLSRYAVVLSQEVIPPVVLGRTLQALRDIKKVLDNKTSGLEVLAKRRVEAYIKGHGKIETEKGSMSATVDGMRFFMKPYRTGLDASKVEALLRAKGKDPTGLMVANISYSLPEEGTVQMEKLKKLLGDELESCKYNESWVIETPE